VTGPLAPLAALAAGALTAAAAAFAVAVPPPPALLPALAALGLATAVRCRRGRSPAWWALAGLALAAAPALAARRDALAVHRLAARRDAAVRIEARVLDGWRRVRWGRRATARVLRAVHAGVAVPLDGRVTLEVRGAGDATRLPPPGSRIEALATVRVPPGGSRPALLVSASPRLVRRTAPPSGIPALRERLARRLLAAAGTDAGLLRAAELAAALSLGRRDLLPPARTTAWRESGLAHVLAVSGLHVGMAGGLLWAALALAAAPAAPSRLTVAAAMVAYAALAGGSASAARAAAMGAVYLVARALGRPLVPMAAVLLALLGTLAVAPAALASPAVQLTFWITAALVRWAPAVASRLPLPRWLAWPVAVPLVAQAAAAPLVAVHLGVLRPGAVLVNLAVLPVLPVLLASALAATALAPVLPLAATGALRAVAAAERVALAAGSVARGPGLPVPPPPAWVQAAVGLLLLAALLPGRHGRRAAAAAVVAAAAVAVLPRPVLPSRSVVALPVHRGAAILASGPRGRILVDGGASRDGALRALVARGVRRLAAVVATHPDADHVTGLPRVVRTLRPRLLLLPRWALRRPETVPLLRAAREVGAAVIPMRRGLAVGVAGASLAAVWPPAEPPPDDNEASLVLAARLGGGTALLPGDAGRLAERRLARTPGVRADVLVLAHHGSRTATGDAFLAAVSPRLALVPAGAGDRRHPHPATLARLARRRIPFCLARGPGPCGAALEGGRWRFLR